MFKVVCFVILSRQKLQTSTNFVIKRVTLFLHNIRPWIVCNHSFFIAKYILPVKTGQMRNNNVPGITDLYRYYPMLDFLAEKKYR